MAQASQFTETQSERIAAGMSADERERKVRDLVLYLLIADEKKIPIKRADISKNVFKDSPKGAVTALLEEAKQKLKEVFGIDVVELEDKKQKTYILANNIENDSEHPHQDWLPEDNAKMGLVMVILTLIFMNGNQIRDSLLYSSLRKLAVDIDAFHEQFGDVKKLITQEFVRQGFINYTRLPNTEPVQFEYTWGPRAQAETTKGMVLQFVCEVYGDVEPSDWKSQYNDVQRSLAGEEES